MTQKIIAILWEILNVTPDSFSDGGKFDSLDAALFHAEEMVNQRRGHSGRGWRIDKTGAYTDHRR